jgi:UDP-glucuronate 4-epimerase
VDIRHVGAIRAVFDAARPEGVIHIAARAGVRPSIEDPVGYADVNLVGTSVVLDGAQRAGVRRVLVASSSSVYGNNEKTPFSEDDSVEHPISPYAATKRACELLCHSHASLTGMPTGCLRFFTVFGPRQRPDLAIRLFLDRVAKGEPIPFFGDGTTSRDYTYIDDIVSGVLAAYDRIDAHGYRIWNLGGSDPVSLSDMVATVGEVVGRTPVLDARPMQPGDVLRTWADLTRSGAELGYAPTTSLREGIERQWAWMQTRARVV